MTWLTEDSVPLLIIGSLATVFMAAIWYQSGGQRFLLYITIAVALVTAGGVGIETLIVTPREEVSNALHAIARALEDNDLPGVLQHVNSTRQNLRDDAESYMARYEITQLKIKRNLTVAIFDSEKPSRAETEFNAVAIGRDGGGMDGVRRYPFFIKVTFLKENDVWRVAAYSGPFPATEGLQRRD